MHWKGPLRRGLRASRDVMGGALAMCGTAKGLAAAGSEIYAGFNVARGVLGVAAPLALAL